MKRTVVAAKIEGISCRSGSEGKVLSRLPVLRNLESRKERPSAELNLESSRTLHRHLGRNNRQEVWMFCIGQPMASVTVPRFGATPLLRLGI